MRVHYRPIGSDWVGERAAWHKSSPFRRAGRSTASGWEYGGAMPWSDTLLLLDRELVALGADEVVFQLDMEPRDIRLDGMPRSDARPRSHAVIISFKSSYGHLRYQCDRFDHWQANVRAIALGLEALRKVDRYGITKRGEQYLGWAALPAQGETGAWAIAYLVEQSRLKFEGLNDVDLVAAYRAAAMRLHPDRGGSREEWDRLQRAKEAAGI